MAKSPKKLSLSPSRDIPFDLLELSQSNVRRIKAGVSIGELADDIVRRTLLQSLNVRPIVDEEGQETGRFEIPAGGRRFRALELLVKQKRLAKDAPVPCIVQRVGETVCAEEDSYAENAFREQLHPLDQFRAMKNMVDKGNKAEAIAAHFMTTPAVVRQRLKLAAVSPKLHEIYAEDGMTLDQLMAFTVSDDHARQEQVWELLGHSFNRSAAFIRQRLTENTVRAQDKRVRFVTIDAYVAAGGGVARDLFEADDGGWLTDSALLDRLVDEKLASEAVRVGAEGWKWVTTAIDLPWSATSGMREIAGEEVPMTEDEELQIVALQEEADALDEQWSQADSIPDEVHLRMETIAAEIKAITERPIIFEPAEVAIAGAFVSIDYDGSLSIERGYVQPDDEPVVESEEAEHGAGAEETGDDSDRMVSGSSGPDQGQPDGGEEDDEDGHKPLSDRLIAELTAWRTLALQDAIAQEPETAYIAVLHAAVLDSFYHMSRESCLQINVHRASFAVQPDDLRDSAPAQSIAARNAQWEARLPDSADELWEALLAFDEGERASLLAHCASLALNAQAEIIPKYDNGRISVHSVAKRLAHSHVLARAVGLDLVTAGWRPTAAGYFQSVTKTQIIADVTAARGPEFAGMIDHLKKGDMAREAEKLLEDSAWLPEILRTPVIEPVDEGDGEQAAPEAIEYAVAAE